MLPLATLARSFQWSGTASRKEFAAFALLLATVVGAAVFAALRLETGPVQRWTLPILATAVLYPGFVAVSVRRMHDMGRTGWWLLLGLVPIAGQILLAAQFLAPPQRSRLGRFTARPAYTVGAALTLALALLLASRIVWQPFTMPSGSMKPTLLVNDVVAVVTPFRSTLTRGDVIAFRHPVNGTDGIKRLIGLPGDTVQMRGGRLFLNGTAVQADPAGEFTETYGPQGPTGRTPVCKNAPVGMGGTCRADRITETLPDAPPYNIIDIGPLAFDDTPVFTVPGGHVFVMGDNRDNSQDSRMPPASGGVGVVPADHVIGRVALVIVSSSGTYWWEFWRWRPGRVLWAVR